MRIKHRSKKEMEYEDAPSGYVTLYNYKEPFMKFDDGFGYQGVLLFDGASDKVQCHFCGNWFEYLGNHLAKEHNMTAREYKELAGLNQTTALIGEKFRAKLIESGTEKRMKNLKKGGKMKEETKEKIRQSLKNLTMEKKNLRGTCPEQLIERLIKCYKEKGGVYLSSKEITFYPTLIRTYGTYKNACEIAGIPYNDPLKALERGRKTMSLKQEKKREELMQYMMKFFEANGRYPAMTDFKKSGKKNFYNLSLKIGIAKIRKEATLRQEKYVRNLGTRGIRFTKDELIDLLRKFEKSNGRKPSYSDGRRGLIPHLSRYSYHFGSWKNALAQAFP